ncbi:unnamed protein product, partial [Pylaiella littoralis]
GIAWIESGRGEGGGTISGLVCVLAGGTISGLVCVPAAAAVVSLCLSVCLSVCLCVYVDVEVDVGVGVDLLINKRAYRVVESGKKWGRLTHYISVHFFFMMSESFRRSIVFFLFDGRGGEDKKTCWIHSCPNTTTQFTAVYCMHASILRFALTFPTGVEEAEERATRQGF